MVCQSYQFHIWAASWQNQQSGMYAHQRLRSAWASAKSDQSLRWRNLGSLATHWAHSEDSDQTGRMPRLIWVFAGRICHFVCFVVRRLICASRSVEQEIDNNFHAMTEARHAFRVLAVFADRNTLNASAVVVFCMILLLKIHVFPPRFVFALFCYLFDRVCKH